MCKVDPDLQAALSPVKYTNGKEILKGKLPEQGCSPEANLSPFRLINEPKMVHNIQGYIICTDWTGKHQSSTVQTRTRLITPKNVQCLAL